MKCETKTQVKMAGSLHRALTRPAAGQGTQGTVRLPPNPVLPQDSEDPAVLSLQVSKRGPASQPPSFHGAHTVNRVTRWDRTHAHRNTQTHTRTWTRVTCRYRTQATRKQMQNTSSSRTTTLLGQKPQGH